MEHNLVVFTGDPANATTLRADLQAKTGDHIVKVKHVPDYSVIRNEIALATGDVLGNARAALDHAVWHIAYHHVGGEPQRPTAVCFPICDSLEGLERDHSEAVIAQIPRPCFYVINESQPYFSNTTHQSEFGHSLVVLRDLVNDDRHRLITPVFLAPASWEMKLVSPEALRLHTLDPTSREWRGETGLSFQRLHERSLKPLEVGLVMAKFTVPGVDAKIDDAGHVTPDVSLPSSERLTYALQRVLRSVQFVLSEFEQVLPTK